MSTIKDLFENEELMNTIVEDLEDFPEDTPVGYEVWALGYSGDEDASPTEDEVLVGEFLDPEEAIAFAEKVNFEIIQQWFMRTNHIASTLIKSFRVNMLELLRLHIKSSLTLMVRSMCGRRKMTILRSLSL